jgi:putative flippase GtrA
MNLNPKTSAAGIAGAVTLLIVYTLGQFGVEIPADVASAITVLVAVAAAYLRSARDWSPRG